MSAAGAGSCVRIISFVTKPSLPCQALGACKREGGGKQMWGKGHNQYSGKPALSSGPASKKVEGSRCGKKGTQSVQRKAHALGGMRAGKQMTEADVAERAESLQRKGCNRRDGNEADKRRADTARGMNSSHLPRGKGLQWDGTQGACKGLRTACSERECTETWSGVALREPVRASLLKKTTKDGTIPTVSLSGSTLARPCRFLGEWAERLADLHKLAPTEPISRRRR